MAINTYEALNTVTLASAASAATFTSIPQGYTDLILVCNVGSQSTNAFPYLQFNGDTGTNYSFSQLYGTGTGAFNSRVANTNQLFNSDVSMKQDAVNATNIYHIMNYSNTTTFKTSLSRQNTLNAADYNGTLAAVGIWRSTAAINRIDVKATRGGTAYNFIAGSTFTLYGVKSWVDEATPKATGGYVYSDSTYWYHSFPFSSTFTPLQALTADVLVVAGGGGGGNANGGGGGGAGGVLGLTSQSLTTTSYTVTIGAGGAMSTDGVNSSFDSSIALKGARGANAVTSSAIGGSGTYGSGGGTGRDPVSGAAQFGGVGTPGQGYNGGNVPAGGNGGSGGGGAGGNGNNAPGDDSEHRIPPNGDGGIGTNAYASWLGATGLGIAGYIAGGGGGAGYQVVRNAVGGLGGGGRGTMANTGSLGATAGMTNTGSGGGGGGTGAFKSNGMPGGSGLVIVRYAK
jgi:hypothetical protein